MDLLGRGPQGRGRAWGCLMRNDIPCPSGAGRLCAYPAEVAGWNQTQILLSIPTGEEQLLSHQPDTSLCLSPVSQQGK